MLLLTGSSGFVGSELIKRFEHSGRRFITIGRSDGDLTDLKTWMKYDSFPVTHVLHLANMSSVDSSWQQPKDFIEFNLGSTLAALDFCKLKSCSLVYLSSFVYEVNDSDCFKEADTVKAHNPYALSKIFAEEAIRFYSEHFGVNTFVIRPFNIFGFGQSENQLLGSIMYQIKNANKVIVRDLRPRRDYVYIKDVVDFISLIVCHYPKGFEVYNLGSGQSYSVEEILVELKDLIDFDFQEKFLKRRSEILDCKADMSTVWSKFKWRPRFSLKEGLIDMLEQIEEN